MDLAVFRSEDTFFISLKIDIISGTLQKMCWQGTVLQVLFFYVFFQLIKTAGVNNLEKSVKTQDAGF